MRHWSSDQVRGHGLCQGESGSGASLGVPARMSDRLCCPYGAAASEWGVFRDAVVC